MYEPVTAVFSGIPTDGIAPLTVDFTNLSTGDFTTCLWDLGDGNSSPDCNGPEHLYTAVGVYTVTLTISGTGGIDSLTQTGLITVYESVTAALSVSPTSGIAPLMVNFINLSSGNYDTCLWAFGDGSSSQVCQNPDHTYETPGMYTVTLTVSGPDGMDTAALTGAVTVYEAVQATFSATPTHGTVPLPVQFTNLSTGDYESCLWEFGDGTFSQTCHNPAHLYATPGVYTVTLTVTGAGGDDTATHTDYVTVELYRIFLPVVLRAGDE